MHAPYRLLVKKKSSQITEKQKSCTLPCVKQSQHVCFNQILKKEVERSKQALLDWKIYCTVLVVLTFLIHARRKSCNAFCEMATRASWLRNPVGTRQAEHQGIEGGSLRCLTTLVPEALGQGGASLFGLPLSCCLYYIEPSQVSPKLASANALAYPYFSFAEPGIFVFWLQALKLRNGNREGQGSTTVGREHGICKLSSLVLQY